MSERTTLIGLFASLAGADRKDEIARRIAKWLGSDDLIVFVRDPELGVLLPALGFPQTLPDAPNWRAFVEGCKTDGVRTCELTSPITGSAIVVMARAAADGSVLAALGGAPLAQPLEEACGLLPIVAAALRREQRNRDALAQAKLDYDLALEYGTLAKVLDEARRNLEYALAETRQALRSRDEFISAASHELRNPLNALHLTVELLLRMAMNGNPIPADDLMARAKRLKVQIERMLRLVNSLLDVSRISAGRLVLQIEDFSIDQLAREIVDRFKDWPGATPIHLSADPIKMRGDRLRIDLVITNLLSNALKYGAGKPVEVELWAADGRVSVRVTDHGIGIAPDDVGRIFERFERACSDGRQVGFGLGLWIAREIVEASGGTISVRSAPSRGSIFTVELPRDLPDSRDEPRAN